jgi:hypothetical protein
VGALGQPGLTSPVFPEDSDIIIITYSAFRIPQKVEMKALLLVSMEGGGLREKQV